MNTIVITQPTYLPWVGYFYLMKQSNFFVFLDNVQFVKRSWQCRNRIKMGENMLYLTVPTHSTQDMMIKDVLIDNSKPWKRKHFKSILRSYNKSPYSDIYMPLLEEVYERDWMYLSDLNIYIIKLISKELKINTKFLRASDINVKGKRTELLLNICKKLCADKYISSIGAKQYLEKDEAYDKFKQHNIEIEIVDFQHPIYKQQSTNFISHLSIIDYLFNCGPDTSSIFY